MSTAHAPARSRLRPLAAALTLALAVPGAAMAQTAKERELEARIAQLERMVEQLVAERASAPTPAPTASPGATSATAAATAPAVSALPAGAQPIQNTTILTSATPGTSFSYGGMIKFDALVTDTSDGRMADGSAGRLFYLPGAIPVGGDDAEGGDAYTDSHAQFSRFWFSVDHVTDGGDKIKAYIEADMFGGGNILGNTTNTNTYGLTLRHAYVSWNEWLAGQTWSNFMDVSALPEAVDFVGPTDGTIFSRQAQLRYTSGAWSVSLENPETTITPYLGGPSVRTEDNVLPDVTARWLTKGDWGHFTVAGLLRQFKNEDEDEAGGAVSVSGRFNLGASDDIRYALNAGSGIGRYLAFGLGSDVVQDENGEIHALDGAGGFVAWRHAFTPKLRSNLMYSMATFDNEIDYTGYGVTEKAYSVHANLIYSPLPKLDVGAELIYGERFLEDEREGDLSRLHTHVKYSF